MELSFNRLLPTIHITSITVSSFIALVMGAGFDNFEKFLIDLFTLTLLHFRDKYVSVI
jgi:hypothetical protein